MYISFVIALVVCILSIQTVCFCGREDVFGMCMHVVRRSHCLSGVITSQQSSMPADCARIHTLALSGRYRYLLPAVAVCLMS